MSAHGLACLALAGLAAGCAAERQVAREVLADPLMRFEPGRPVLAPGAAAERNSAPLATDTLRIRVDAGADPGDQVAETWLASSVRTAVEVAAGFGLEAGYGLELSRERLFRFDGFAGPLAFERLRHGPDAALVYDDGTSVVRAGYSFRTAFDGDLHEPSISARTLILGSDTVVELAYRRTMAAVEVGAADGPAADPIDAERTADRIGGAVEQGFLPGVNLRLDLVAIIEDGFLQSPYRLISLWSHWPASADDRPQTAPQSRPEHHPDSRIRWGALARSRFAIPAWAATFELGAGHGEGSWRVEHSQALIGWRQRLGERFRLELGGGVYHQTRASFYRDDYPDGPPGAYWSADRRLSSYVAWWARLGLGVNLIPERGRLLGMFTFLDLELTARVVSADYNFEGLDSVNGVTGYASFGDPVSRQAFDGGMQFGGWFGLVAGF